MAILNPEHLLEQAEKLIAPPPAGAPRQVDLRRAISAAYYSVFHRLLTAAADEFVGVTKRSSPQYGLVYRSIDHRGVRELCNDVTKQPLPERLRRFAPTAGLSPDVQAFGAAVSDLQEKRHGADYNPMMKVRTADARVALETARTALVRFAAIGDDERRAFVALLLFRPR